MIPGPLYSGDPPKDGEAVPLFPGTSTEVWGAWGGEPARVFRFPGLGNLHLVDVAGDDMSIVRAARVSYNGDKNERLRPPEQNAKLLRYMLEHGHWSPFEHASLTVEVEAPIFVARQWMRHRSQSFNEVSGRYQELKDRFYRPQKWRRQSKSNRQASEGELGWFQTAEADVALDRAYEAVWREYQYLLGLGVCREQARAVLPFGIFTRFYATMNVRSALHFIGDRDHPDAQAEITHYARAIASILEWAFPMTWEGWKEVRE